MAKSKSRQTQQLSIFSWLRVHLRRKHHLRHGSHRAKKAAIHRPAKEHPVLVKLWLSLAVVVVLSIVVSPFVGAATQTWSQTDWSGGVGSGDSQYVSASTSVTAGSGAVGLAPSGDWCATANCTDDWTIRRRVAIDSTVAKTDYQVELKVAYETGMNNDFSDIRFVSPDGTSDMDYWLERKTDGVEAVFWVKIPTLANGANEIMMYYGNSAAASLSDGEATFMFFDDFEGASIDASKWEVVSPATFSISGGKLAVSKSGNGWSASIASQQGFNRADQLAVDYDYLWVTNNTGYDAIMMGWRNSKTDPAYARQTHGYYNIGAGNATTVAQRVYENGTSIGLGGGSHDWSMAVPYDVSVRLKSSSGARYLYRSDPSLAYIEALSSSAASSSPLHVGFSVHSGRHDIDNVRVRQWSQVEPTVTFAAASEGPYEASGELVSRVFQADNDRTLWGQASFASANSSGVKLFVRTGSQSDMGDAAAFAGCNEIASGTDISDNNCVDDGDQYIQYRLELSSDGYTATTVTAVNIEYDYAAETPDQGEQAPPSASGGSQPSPTATPTSSGSGGGRQPSANAGARSAAPTDSGPSRVTHNQATAQEGRAQPTDLTPLVDRLDRLERKDQRGQYLLFGIGLAIVSGIIMNVLMVHSAYMRYLSLDGRRNISAQPGRLKMLSLWLLGAIMSLGIVIMLRVFWLIVAG
ncbi:hypothetical protein CR970_04185 [Candidatus Saccharibacteria bacterium]|nr:MAG: hypothetical protein CR970_04185 [Candidatus Saccharibacteria bacterium]